MYLRKQYFDPLSRCAFEVWQSEADISLLCLLRHLPAAAEDGLEPLLLAAAGTWGGEAFTQTFENAAAAAAFLKTDPKASVISGFLLLLHQGPSEAALAVDLEKRQASLGIYEEILGQARMPLQKILKQI